MQTCPNFLRMHHVLHQVKKDLCQSLWIIFAKTCRLLGYDYLQVPTLKDVISSGEEAEGHPDLPIFPPRATVLRE